MRVEGADRPVALEHAVAQRGDVDVVVARPDGQVGRVAGVDRPHAVLNARHGRLVDRVLRHAGILRVADPDRAVRALLRQQRGIGVADFKRAVPRQVEVLDTRVRKGIRRDVDGRVEVEHQIVQAGARKGAGADALHVFAEVQLRAPRVFKRALADDAQGLRQLQRVVVAIVHERAVADLLKALVPHDQAAGNVVERLRADGAQRGGEHDVLDVARLTERLRADRFKPFRQNQAVDRIIVAHRFLADGAHRHAADALRDDEPCVHADIAGDFARLRVDLEVTLLDGVLHDDGVLPARAQAACRAVRVRERRRVGIHLVVRHDDHAVVRQPVKQPVRLFKHRALAQEAHLAQALAGAERAADIAHGRGHRDAFKRPAAVEVARANDLQAFGQRHVRQSVHKADDALLQRAQRVREREAGDVVLVLQLAAADGVHQAAVHLVGHDDIAAERAVELRIQVVGIVAPYALLRRCGQCERQQTQNRQQHDGLFHVLFLP